MIKRIVEFWSAAILAFCLFPAWAAGQSPPHVFFTDLISGPNTGGENNNGTILTLYGKRFGATQGTSSVTVGGGAVAAYKLWSDTKIAVAIGPAAKSGSVVVTVGGVSSNVDVAFTVRAGSIRCISPTGSDSNTGLWGSCWGTVPGAVHNAALVPGDIIYALDKVQATVNDPIQNYTCDVCITENGGTAAAPTALVGYPGATVTIGDLTSGNAGIRVPNIPVTADYWTLANLHTQARTDAMSIESSGTNGWRVVGNDLYCPYGDTGPNDGCYEGDQQQNMKFFGNNVHDVGTLLGTSTKFKHGVYWSTDSNHIEAGWNTIGPVKHCRGVQFHSSPTGSGTGFQQFDLHVHDNYIHDIQCDGINFATVDPSKGPVEAFNNIIVHVGTGPGPSDGSANYAGVYVPNTLNAGSACSSGCIVNVYNNTIYDAGAPAMVALGAGALMVETGPNSMIAKNNIIYQLSGEAYINGGGASGTVTCDTNDWFGAGAALSTCTNSLNADPQFANIAARDFHIVAGSPAVNAGLAIPGLTTDFDGNSRPQGAAFDMGAYELVQGTLQRPNPPSNLQVTVK